MCPGLLEDARRRGVLGERQREQAQQVQALESTLRRQDERLRDDAAAPERLAQPVADLGGETLDVRAGDHADTANGFAVHFDRELGLLPSSPTAPARKARACSIV